jgi:uncharacterized protein involved in outer membrane biogenesis
MFEAVERTTSNEKKKGLKMLKNGWQWLLRKHRMVTVVSMALLGVLASIIIIGFVPFSNTMIKNTIERIIRESLPGSMSIEKTTITLWSGISLKNVRYSYKDQKNAMIDCSIRHITVSYYLLPILFKHLIVKNVTLDRPEILCNFPAAAPNKTNDDAPFSMSAFERVLGTIPYTIVVRNISVVDARISIQREGRSELECNGVTISMKVGLKRTLTLEGRLGIAELEIAKTWRIEKLKASLRVLGNEVTLKNCQASAYGGVLSIKGDADVSEGTLNGLDINVDNVKIGEWYRLNGVGQGELTGKLDAAVKLGYSKLVVDSLNGTGWIKMTNVSARNIPLQKSILVRLITPKLAAVRFSRIYSDFTLSKGKIHNEKCIGKGDPLDFTSDGWIGLGGGISQNAEGILSEDLVRVLPPMVKNSLLSVPGDDEKRSFKCAISGTFKNPKYHVDERIQQQTVHNVFDALGKGLGRFFKK